MANDYRVPGPVTMTWNTNSLGVSKSGVIIRITTHKRPITDDAHGNEPADWIFTGKSATVEGIFLDLSTNTHLIRSAAPYIGDFLSNRSGSTDLIGRIAKTASSSDDLTKALRITEAIHTDGVAEYWEADHALPIEPSQYLLSSVQEGQLPFAFMIIPDPTTFKLFSHLPTYLYT